MMYSTAHTLNQRLRRSFPGSGEISFARAKASSGADGLKSGMVGGAPMLDVGPYHTDDAAYVFGSARPREHPNNDAGLDVSPAVRTYLGLNGTDCCDLRFVEARSVAGPLANKQHIRKTMKHGVGSAGRLAVGGG